MTIHCESEQESISIHALREEGDQDKIATLTAENQFLSTPSARRATEPPRYQLWLSCISIHALREEGDCKVFPNCKDETNFYPRPPRGGRLGYLQSGYFYPRPPRGGRPIITL